MPAAPGGVHAARSVRRGPSRDPSRYERLDRSSTQVASEDARIDGATHDKRALVAMDQPVPTLGRALTDRWRSYSRSANGASISFAASIPRSLARALRRRQTGHASRRQVASEDARIDGATHGKRALAAMDQPVPTLGRALTDGWRSYSTERERRLERRRRSAPPIRAETRAGADRASARLQTVPKVPGAGARRAHPT
jgi:hypothetical protein